MNSDILDRVCGKLGSQAALAELCRVSPQAISKWKASGIPPKQVRTIEAATGIPARELRPDIFGEPQRGAWDGHERRGQMR